MFSSLESKILQKFALQKDDDPPRYKLICRGYSERFQIIVLVLHGSYGLYLDGQSDTTG